jgi:hypothetical protein
MTNRNLSQIAITTTSFCVNQEGSRGTPLQLAAMSTYTINLDAFRYLITVANVNAQSTKATNSTGPNRPPVNRTPLDVANTDEKREILRATGAKLAKEL